MLIKSGIEQTKRAGMLPEHSTRLAGWCPDWHPQRPNHKIESMEPCRLFLQTVSLFYSHLQTRRSVAELVTWKSIIFSGFPSLIIPIIWAFLLVVHLGEAFRLILMNISIRPVGSDGIYQLQMFNTSVVCHLHRASFDRYHTQVRVEMCSQGYSPSTEVVNDNPSTPVYSGDWLKVCRRSTSNIYRSS